MMGGSATLAGPDTVMELSESCLEHHIAWERDPGCVCSVRTKSAVVSLSVPCHCTSSRSSETTTVLKHLSLPKRISCLLRKRGAKCKRF